MISEAGKIQYLLVDSSRMTHRVSLMTRRCWLYLEEVSMTLLVVVGGGVDDVVGCSWRRCR